MPIPDTAVDIAATLLRTISSLPADVVKDSLQPAVRLISHFIFTANAPLIVSDDQSSRGKPATNLYDV